MQLDMLCPCTIKPEHLARSFIFGPHDFNKDPLAPLGSKVMMHEGTFEQGLWSDQGIKGFFVGSTHEHYRCYQCLNPSINGIWTTNSIKFFPKWRMPTTSLLDQLNILLADLTDAIKNQHLPRINKHSSTDYNTAFFAPAEFFFYCWTHHHLFRGKFQPLLLCLHFPRLLYIRVFLPRSPAH